MKYVKMLGLAAVAAMALSAFVAGPASASTLRSGTTALGVGAKIESSLKAGTSALLKDTGGLANDTCTGSEVKGSLSSVTPSSNPKGSISSLTFTGCSHTTTVLANGELEIKNIAGTTNGTVVSRNSRVTIKSTVFGISCTANTGEGTTIGTLTGVTSGNATMDINGVITLENGCGDSTWTGTYLVTNPAGLNVEG